MQVLSLEQERLVVAKSLNKLHEERDELLRKVAELTLELEGSTQLQIQLKE